MFFLQKEPCNMKCPFP